MWVLLIYYCHVWYIYVIFGFQVPWYICKLDSRVEVSKSNDGGEIATGPKVSGGSQRKWWRRVKWHIDSVDTDFWTGKGLLALYSFSQVILWTLRSIRTVYDVDLIAYCDRNDDITWIVLVSLSGAPIKILRWLPPETFGPIAIPPPSLDLDTSALESILHTY